MTLIVSPLQSVAAQLARSRPARVVSLLSPEQAAPDIAPGLPRLALHFHDIAAPRRGLTPPDRAMVERLLAFAAAWSEPAPMLVHCWMGVSRSTAAALVLACALDPARDEQEAASALRRASPTATPNPLMVALADDILGRDGRLKAAADRIGRGQDADGGHPFAFPARRGAG
jgi:predicted protein tyrosine phosphatase